MKKYPFILTLFVLLLLVVGRSSFASTISLEPQDQSIGTRNSFTFAIDIDADEEVNAISVGVQFPPEITPGDIIDGESVIGLWVDAPTWNPETRILSFSGIIPGGYKGKGQLLKIVTTVEATDGMVTLRFDQTKTRVLVNGQDAQEGHLDTPSLSLPIVAGKDNLASGHADTEPPETFFIQVTRTPSLYNNNWFASFTTKDKNSGVDYYEIAERKGGPTSHFDVLKWKKTESPSLLQNQNLTSTIYVRVVDRAGNVRVAVSPARYPLPWYERKELWITIGIVVVCLLMRLAYKKWSLRKSLDQ